MFEISEQPTEKVRIFGVEYGVRKPTVEEVDSLSEKLEAAKSEEKAAFGIMIAYVDALGVPKEAVKRLTVDQFTALIEHLNGAKKN